MYRLKTSMGQSTDGGSKDARYQPLIRENAPHGTKFFRDWRPDRRLAMAAALLLFVSTPCAQSPTPP
jgi:hypothetical protein